VNDGQTTAAALEGDPPQGAGASGPAAGLSLRALLQRGTIWSLSAYAGSQLLRFAGNLILTRLLMPEAFGVMSLVNALLVGLQLLSDVGIGPSIIQSERGDEPGFLDTAWTLQVGRGFVLWLATCAVALPFAAFYGESALAWVLPVAGLSAVISGFNATRLFSMYRQVDLARVSVIELSSQAAGVVVMVGWSLVDRSLAALVAGGLASSLVRMVLSHTVLPGIRNRLHWDRGAFGHLVHFGRWIFLSTLLTFLVGQSDRLIFGKLIPIAMLGVFGVGSMIATLPSDALSRMASSVMFPVFSRVRNSGQELASVFPRVRRPLLVVAAWMIAGLGGGGTAAVRLLYDQRWAEAGWIVQLLALGSWFGVLEATNGAALLAGGRPKWIAASGAGKLLGMVLLIPLGFRLGGFPGAVLGLASSEMVRYAVSAFATDRAGLRSWPQDLRLSCWLFATAWLGWFLGGLVLSRGLPVVAAAGLIFVVVSLCWAPPALVCLRAARGGGPRTRA